MYSFENDLEQPFSNLYLISIFLNTIFDFWQAKQCAIIKSNNFIKEYYYLCDCNQGVFKVYHLPK